MTHDMRDAHPFPLLSQTDLSLNLDRQRHRAKRLRDDARSGETQALARLAAHHPRAAQLKPGELKLTDAQLVVAREAGLQSWPALKAHVEQIEQARSAIEAGEMAPDSDLPTLHLRCGNDIEQALVRAGFAGDFLMVADPVCQGPLSDGPSAVAERARFIASEYPGENEALTLGKLQQAEDRLSQAGAYGRIVLWFEHDPFDQLLLVRILARLRQMGAHRRKVELISLDRFPGMTKFLGIGQLSPAALRHLYASRRPVTESAYAMAEQAWLALLADTPMPLFALTRQATPSLPYLPAAILRYLAELPAPGTGLSFTEAAILGMLAGGPLAWGRIFARFMQEVDPLPFHGDLMFFGTVLRLRDAGIPALASDPADSTESDWGKAVFRLTPAGQDLLEGRRDWRDCVPRHRFNGGVSCFSTPDWRWDAGRQQPVATDPGQDRP